MTKASYQSMDSWNRDYERVTSSFLIVFFLVLFVANVLFIVNNGNILTGGTDERKHLKRKYNEL